MNCIRKIKQKYLLRNILWYVAIFVVFVIIAIMIRIFFVASFKVPTPSMKPTIWPGDYVLIDKTVPGARVFKNFQFLTTGGKPDYFRCPGKRDVERNDVLVFNYPYSNWNKLGVDLNTYYVKRCVAIPGDVFYIENGIYKVECCSDTLGNYGQQRKVCAQNNVSEKIYRCYPFDEKFDWNIRHFGPLYLPRRGDKIALDHESIILYKKLIEYESGGKLTMRNGQYFLNDNHVVDYTFQTNYYFMAGDQPLNSKDSRYWGPLPEDHIIGKATLIWKSKDMHTGQYRWNRCLKIIH